MKSIVVLPTYNEKENVRSMIDALLAAAADIDVLVCDDASPDGTGELVASVAEKDPRVRLSSGPPKQGLGRAYLRGFKLALEGGYGRIVQMDCDFSHDPALVPVLLRALDEFDLALGSRYVLGGGTVNWPWHRRLISRSGSFYSRTVLGINIRDLTGGFKAWRKEALEAIDLPSIFSEGYAFQIETTFRALKKGLRIVQIPITFVDRRVGQTKMSGKEIVEAIKAVWKMRYNAP